MGTQDVLSYLHTEPFRPFRIHMVGGRNFNIRHPEMVKVGRTSVTIFTFVSNDPNVYDRFTTVSLGFIENLDHIDTPAAS